MAEPAGRRVVVAFGSNVGDRIQNLTRAIQATTHWGSLIEVSGFYETRPLYLEDQASFLNGVLLAETTIAPGDLLDVLKELEVNLGRQERLKNGPREVDLDIIWYEDFVSQPGVTPIIPHPRAHERRFVLEPLAEIAPDLDLYGFGKVRDLLSDPGVQSQEVRRVGDAPILV